MFEFEKTEIPAFLNSKPVSGALYVSLYAFGKVLSRFNFKRRKYMVYIALIKRAEQFTTIFENRMNAVVGEDDYSQKLKYDRRKYFSARFEVEQLDESKAAQQIYENVNLFIRFYKF